MINKKIAKIIRTINTIDQININTGKLLANSNLLKKDQILQNIHFAEFKVFSQWGDDGIINFLCNYLDIENKIFVEFGVENYTECNTKFLLVNDNWSGLVFDGSKEHIEEIKRNTIYWKHDLKASAEFITAENINQLLTENGLTGEIGLLHIDIDGNDYWVWKEINVIEPTIVIVEYNSVFGKENAWTIPYNPLYQRKNGHFSNLYYGTSLLALVNLANAKGYKFVGCNSNGNNAYFVKETKLKDLKLLKKSIFYYFILEKKLYLSFQSKLKK